MVVIHGGDAVAELKRLDRNPIFCPAPDMSSTAATLWPN